MKDPCVEYIKLDRSENPISDDLLEEGWYRVFSDNGDAMPTVPPGTEYCGTTNPFWLNGTEGNCSKIKYECKVKVYFNQYVL